MKYEYEHEGLRLPSADAKISRGRSCNKTQQHITSSVRTDLHYLPQTNRKDFKLLGETYWLKTTIYSAH